MASRLKWYLLLAFWSVGTLLQVTKVFGQAFPTARLPPHNVVIQNRGVVQLNFVIGDNNSQCATGSIDAGRAAYVELCGPMIIWNDGHATQSLNASEGAAYEFFWSSDRWALRQIDRR